jgi:hypothetical protein
MNQMPIMFLFQSTIYPNLTYNLSIHKQSQIGSTQNGISNSRAYFTCKLVIDLYMSKYKT